MLDSAVRDNLSILLGEASEVYEQTDPKGLITNQEI